MILATLVRNGTAPDSDHYMIGERFATNQDIYYEEVVS
jgi:hypothetical protein